MMDWPGNSLYLNPIENLWAIMKSRLKKLPNITSLPLLIKAIKMMWTRDLPIALMKKLAHSMPARLKMCLKNKHQMKKYFKPYLEQSLFMLYKCCKYIMYMNKHTPLMPCCVFSHFKIFDPALLDLEVAIAKNVVCFIKIG